MTTAVSVAEKRNKSSRRFDLQIETRTVAVAVLLPCSTYFSYITTRDNYRIIDDWQVVPIAGFGHPRTSEPSALWRQWSHSREVVGGFAFIGFGFFDHLSERAYCYAL